MDINIKYIIKCSNADETEFRVREISNGKYDVIQYDVIRNVYFNQKFNELKDAIEFAETLAQVFEAGYEHGCHDYY